MDEELSDASTGERPQEPVHVRPKRTRQQPTRLEDETAGGKKTSKEPKKPKDAPSGDGKDQWLEAIKELTNVVKSQSKMIKEQGTKLQEFEVKLVQRNRLEQEEKGKLETKLAAIESLLQKTQLQLAAFSQQAIPTTTENLAQAQWP